MSLEVTKQELLKQAIYLNKLYATTRNQEYKDQETRIRRIVVELDALTIGTSNVTNLDSLSDVTISAPTNAQVLAYNSTTNQWENQTPTAGGGADMSKSTYDVDNTGVVDNAESISIIGRNSTGSTLYKGTVVYISGSTGNRPNFAKAQANAEATSAGTFGVVRADIANNSDGYVVCIGYIDNLDTRTTATNPFTNVTLADGDTVYLHPTIAGYITNVKPSAPNHVVYVGKVTRTSPTNGTIVYRIQNGYELDEIHDVAISSKANNDLLVYESATSLWKNKTFAAIFGGTPLVSVPTLDQVTTAGNTTTNAITVGGLTVNGIANIVGASSTTSPILTVTNTSSGNFTFMVNNTGTGNANFGFQINSVNKATIGYSRTGDYLGFFHQGATPNYFLLQLNNDGSFQHNRTSDGNPDFKIFSSGNVLIQNGGTFTDAGYKLDVNGSLRVVSTGWIRGHQFSEAGNVHTYQVGYGAYGQFELKTANGAQFVLCATETGRVGIGTTTPSAKLQVSDSITASSALAQGVYFNNTLVAAANNDVLVGLDINPTYTKGAFTGVLGYGLRITSPNTTDTALRLVATEAIYAYSAATRVTFNIDGTYGQLWNVRGLLYIDQGANSDMIFRTNAGSERMRIFAAGNIGINTTTDAGYKLDVNGSLRTNSTVNFTGLSSSTTSQVIYYNSSTGLLTYGAAPSGGGGTLDTVTTSGNTTTNSISVGGLTVANGAAPIAVFNSSNGGGTYLAIQYNGVLKAGWGMGGNIVGAANSVNDVGFWSSHDMFWETNGANRMSLNSSGRLLLNTITDTGEVLQVNGVVKANSFTSSGGAGFSGTFTVPTNPPGQQNLNISGGIIISVS